MLFRNMATGTGGAPGDTVQLLDADTSNAEGPGYGGTVYAGLKFDADGLLYRRVGTSAWQAVGAWLIVGVNTTFYLSRVVNSGTLTTDGGTIQQLNADEIYDVQVSTPTSKTCSITFHIYDNGTETEQNGFPVSRTYLFDAEIADAG